MRFADALAQLGFKADLRLVNDDRLRRHHLADAMRLHFLFHPLKELRGGHRIDGVHAGLLAEGAEGAE
jgi:hypothetical protein